MQPRRINQHHLRILVADDPLNAISRGLRFRSYNRNFLPYQPIYQRRFPRIRPPYNRNEYRFVCRWVFCFLHSVHGWLACIAVLDNFCIFTRNTFRWFASSTSKRKPSKSHFSPGAGTFPLTWLSSPAMVVTVSSADSPKCTPSISSSSPIAGLPRMI